MRIEVDLDLRRYKLPGQTKSQTKDFHAKVFETYFEAQTSVNVAFLAGHPKTPLIYQSGVRWVAEGSPELWKDIPNILLDGYDDCEGMACWLAAEMRTRAPNSVLPYRLPSAVVRLNKTGRANLWHAVVKDANDLSRVWDPSKKLGMKGDG